MKLIRSMLPVVFWFFLFTTITWFGSAWILSRFGYQTGMTTLHSLLNGGFGMIGAMFMKFLKLWDTNAKQEVERDRQHQEMWEQHRRESERRDKLMTELETRLYRDDLARGASAGQGVNAR